MNSIHWQYPKNAEKLVIAENFGEGLKSEEKEEIIVKSSEVKNLDSVLFTFEFTGTDHKLTLTQTATIHMNFSKLSNGNNLPM